MPFQKTINFVRTEGLHATTVSVVSVLLSHNMDDEDIVAAMDRAVTRWINETQSGKDAWADSCEDFNIGDLSENKGDESLMMYLSEQGILHLDIETSDTSRAFNFDRVLGNAS